ncbi:hypothetical protein T08_1814 [Trichinella sp. T8]|nr:hypothetical protein T08_1814 [Trichinella sp. T8]
MTCHTFHTCTAVHLKKKKREGGKLLEKRIFEYAISMLYTGVSSCVTFQVESVVEAFAAECAKMALGVTVQKTLQWKLLKILKN